MAEPPEILAPEYIHCFKTGVSPAFTTHKAPRGKIDARLSKYRPSMESALKIIAKNLPFPRTWRVKNTILFNNKELHCRVRNGRPCALPCFTPPGFQLEGILFPSTTDVSPPHSTFFPAYLNASIFP